MPILNFENRLFALETAHISYIFGLSEKGFLANIYWGKKIPHVEDFLENPCPFSVVNLSEPQILKEEFSAFGTMHFKETALKVTFSDQVRDFRYRLSECQVEDERLELILQDEFYPFRIHLFYEVFPEADLIRRWSSAENTGSEPIVIERFCSAQFGLPGTGYTSLNYNGRWGAEFLEHFDPVTVGKKVYESLYGLTAHTANPVFLVHKNATETTGDVYYGALSYSGNFKVTVEAVNAGFTNILIGMNDTDFSWRLNAGETFTTPAVYAGYSDGGFEKMTHTLHSFALEQLIPRELADKPLPVLYNSWYSTTFSVRCSEQIELARRAAAMGVELFVVDDGWFIGRNDDTAGLGDWYVDPEKFPNGMNELIDEVHRLGMKFGLWIEPEMVNPKSRLFSKHPEWVLSYPNREILMGRNQYELDMANPEVVDYLIQVLDELLSENAIDYIKWDMNRYLSEAGSPTREPRQWKELHFRSTEGVYRLAEELKKRHPKVELEACASGGGRVDYGALERFDEYWPSDNTDPLDRLFIQEAYSYFYPVKYMRAWLTDDFGMNQRKLPLAFSMHSSMCGVLGIGIDLNRASDEKLTEIAGYIADYKKVRNTVQFGELYRLSSLKTASLQAVQYVRDNQSALFLFLDHERFGETWHTVKLRGLKENAVYEYELDGKILRKTGAYLMQFGLALDMKGDYDSRLIIFTEKEA